MARGNPAARLMVIGEAPGAEEDRLGEPFVGRSGQLLDRLLVDAGIDGQLEAYFVNGLKCRPPQNRRPSSKELAACWPWLEQQIKWVDPALLLLVGATAVEALLGRRGAMGRLRGQWLPGEGHLLQSRWLMPIFHPAYLLRNPSEQPQSPRWHTRADLGAVRLRLDDAATEGQQMGKADLPC
jgi:DNA polymerase